MTEFEPWGPPPPYRPPLPPERAALAAIYRRIEEALAPVAACRACGTCCRFTPGGIVLFSTALEMVYLISEAGWPPAGRLPAVGPPDAAWQCPYQEGDRCAAHLWRPLGCRTYFCDAAARAVGERLYGPALMDIRRVAEGQGHSAWYGPARLYWERLSGQSVDVPPKTR